MKILITLKNIDHVEKIGGIGFYYKVLQNYFSNGVEYFNFSHDSSKNPLIKSFYRLLDTIFFTYRCISKNKSLKLIHLNPSLSWYSIIRDGLLLLIADWSAKKTIVFFRGWHSYMENAIEKNWIFKILFKWIYGRADTIIVLSDRFRSTLHQWGVKQNINIETTVVDNKLLNGYNQNVEGKEKSKNITLLFLARVEKSKGIIELIEAYDALKRKYPRINLTIAGDGSQFQQVRELIDKREIKNVDMLGFVSGEAKARAFANSDIYIFPTTHGEGMPNSVLEAMAFGLPVITRPVGGLKDFFEHGRMGFITESKDPAFFAEYIERLIIDPELRMEMSLYNAEFARKHFLASVVAKRLERIYQDVLNGTQKEYSWLDEI